MTDIIWTNITVRLGDLKPWSDNPRLSTKAQAKRLLASFDKFGQVEAIAVGPGLEVYDGHQRLSALLTIHGDKYELDARQSNRPLTEAERRELVISLHAGAVGSWDWDKVSAWDASELQGWGMDKDLLKGWNNDANNLKELLKSEQPSADAEAQVDRAAELLEKWQVQPGDMFAIGEHRLICGDCTDAATVARVMDGEKAGACVTDSPYGINREGIENDDPEGLRKLFNGCLKVMSMENGVLVNFQSPRLFPEWLDVTRGWNYKFERMLWLYMPVKFPSFAWHGWYLRSDCILVSSIGKAEYLEADKHQHDVYVYEHKNELSDGWHGSVKPLEVVQDLVSRVSGDVYDPFSGSGTTLVACQNLSRKCRAVEISPAYVAVALERMSQAFPTLDILRL